jgi:hypothetical protein
MDTAYRKNRKKSTINRNKNQNNCKKDKNRRGKKMEERERVLAVETETQISIRDVYSWKMYRMHKKWCRILKTTCKFRQSMLR